MIIVLKKKCDYQKLAIEDVRQIKAKASETGMKMAFEPCDGLTRERYCIYVAWDETNPKMAQIKMIVQKMEAINLILNVW